MKIAVTFENGTIFQHFGHTAQFKVYEVAEGKVLQTQILDTCGSGHSALAGLLHDNGIDVLLCGGIGGGAKTALAEAGIRLYGGVSGNADKAVQDFLADALQYDPDVHCSHHDSEHGQGGHTCSAHGCGKHDCKKA